MLEVKKFEADWCGPCKALKPILENVVNKFGNTVNFSYINIDEQFEVAQKYHVRSVPTVIIEKDGVEVNRFVGVQSELAYTNSINENL
jgi:thioredoxin 1|tara:strand:+ start:11941 stop:12204 length:264 start_codon:yes stop_codon:yes gene_type:complete